MRSTDIERFKVGRIVLSLALLAGFVNTLHAQQEITVIGCVTDFGKQPYSGVRIGLKGLNYEGGDGYTNNSSVDSTDRRGEFSLRMKAGTPDRPAQAKLTGSVKPYVTHGWAGQTKDVWPEIVISNIGQPLLDLRKSGCIKYPYPISVSGEIFNDAQEVSPSLLLKFTANNDTIPYSVSIPAVLTGGKGTFDFGVDLVPHDYFEVDIAEQPKGAICRVSPKRGYAGVEHQVNVSENNWSEDKIRIYCNAESNDRKADNTANSSPDLKPETSPTSTRNSVAEIADTLQQGINKTMGWLSNVFSGNAKPSSDSSTNSTAPSTSPVEPPEQQAAYKQTPAPRALSASEQCSVNAKSCNSGCMGVAVLGFLSLLANSSAGVNEASNQTQLCSNRCDEELISCQQQASGDQHSSNSNSTGTRSSIPACTPGPNYDAQTCNCKLNPLSAGCGSSNAAPSSNNATNCTMNPNPQTPRSYWCPGARSPF